MTGLDALRASAGDKRGRRRRCRAGNARGCAGRVGRPRLRLPFADGLCAVADGTCRDPNDVPPCVAAGERDRRLGDRAVPCRLNRARHRDRITHCSLWCGGGKRGSDRRSRTRGLSGTRCATPVPPSSSAAPPWRSRLLALLALPVPFMRSIGIAGLLIALVSVAVAVTLLPVVLGDDRAEVRLSASKPTRRPGKSWLVGLGASDRAPPLARRGGLDRRAGGPWWSRPRTSSSETRSPPRSPRRGPQRPVLRTWIWTPASAPGRSRPSTRSSAQAYPGDVAGAFAQVDGVHSAAAPADWRREGTAIVAVDPDSGWKLHTGTGARQTSLTNRPPLTRIDAGRRVPSRGDGDPGGWAKAAPKLRARGRLRQLLQP